MPDILYTSFNRLAFTQASFAQLIANTNWKLVGKLYIHDDASTDGTAEWLEGAIAAVPAETVFSRERHDGPVAAMNWYLDQIWPGFGSFIKIDNDYVVCPGWLDEIKRVADDNMDVDVIGFAPQFGPSVPTPTPRELEPAGFIGGIGLIRHRIFEACRPVSGGRQGWWAFQERHDRVPKAWVKPDLPCFELDRLPVEPWSQLSGDYIRCGWQRDWGFYDPSTANYWDWFIELDQEAAA
jgi:glycosyltransferase involved in cell wall biosynthesis